MIEPSEPRETLLEYDQLVITSWRAIRRYSLSELESVIAGEVVNLSFAIGRPHAWVQHRIDLVRLTGVPKNKIYPVLTRLSSAGVVQTAEVGDGYLLTFLPPCQDWPWEKELRIKTFAGVEHADRLEAQLIHETLHWPRQAEFFPPPLEEQYKRATAIARMRECLYELHKKDAAIALSGRMINFPVTDRSPGGPALTGLSSQGLSRPLGTSQSLGVTADSGSAISETASETREIPGGSLLGSQNGTLLGSPPLRALKLKRL